MKVAHHKERTNDSSQAATYLKMPKACTLPQLTDALRSDMMAWTTLVENLRTLTIVVLISL